MKKTNLTILGTIILIGICKILQAQHQISVDLSNQIRPVSQCASGSLYGITEDLPIDIESLVAPLNPYMFCLPPSGDAGNQHRFGSAIVVSERLENVSSAKIQITLPDLLPGWPYNWPGKETWLELVTTAIQNKIATGRDNFHSYNIWNEHDGTWLEANGDFYTECWKPTYDLIKSLDPTAKICGPGIAYYHRERLENFLTFCKENNCIPDYIAWHQWGAAGIPGAIQNYRELENSLNIGPLEICINEYSSQIHDPYEGCPGFSVPFIAKFERHGVESACISWWHTSYPGRLGSLLTPSNEKGGGWHLYKWYGEMTGQMVNIVPPNDKSDGIDGFGCIDIQNHYASICIGGNNTGIVDVNISGIPSSFGSAVNVRLEYVPWEDKDSPVAATTTISNTQYTISNQSISVPVNVSSILYAYRIYITPVVIMAFPEIEISTPTNNESFAIPNSITIDANATDEDGTISNIFFFINYELVQEEWIAPYAWEWTPTEPGEYQIRAIATDNDGNTAEGVITINVNPAQAPYNDIPQSIPGKIEFEHYDVGGNGFAYFDTTDGNTGGADYRMDEDVDLEDCDDEGNGYNLGWTLAGEWLEYTVNVTTTGTYNITFRVACNGEGRTISLSSNGNTIANNIAIPNTEGWQTWIDVTIEDVQLTVGEQILRLTIGETDYVNLNYMTFTLKTEPTEAIQLLAGWNIIGYPFLEANDLEDALSSIWDNLEIIKDYDSFFIKNDPNHINSLEILNYGKGYFVKVNEDCELQW